MKRILLALVCLISGILHADEDTVAIDYDLFHDTLAPYGVWFNVAAYGPVWQPSGVDDDWAPYTDGYWAYTDAGWTWVSYEEWGAITYHYGRWVRFQQYGWCWVPGYEWGPAWVSWRMSDECIGWAPLPPEARWRRATGFGPWVDAEFDLGPASFRFCRVRDFGAPVIRKALLPPSGNAAFIEQTWNVTNITHRDDRDCTFNGGLDPAWLAPLVLQPVPVLRLVRNRVNVFAPGTRGNVFIQTPKEGALVIAAPPRHSAPETPRKSPSPSKVNAVPVIDHGWGGPQNDPERARILAAFRQQLQGANSQISPAKPFHPGLVAIVPNHAQEIVEPPPPRRPAAVAAPVIVPEPVARSRSRSSRSIVVAPPPDLPPPAMAPPPPPNHAREQMAARQRDADARAMEQQRAAEAQRRTMELNARRHADAAQQQQHMEFLRRQQAAGAARSQPIPPPPSRAPIAPPPPQQPPPRMNPPGPPPVHPLPPGPPGSPPPPGDPRRRGQP